MKKILLFSLLFTLIATNLMAEEQKDTAFANLYRRYFQLYTEGNESIFYDASAKMKDYYLRNNKYDSYYKIALNEILYDTEQGKTYRAIKKCNNLLNEMNARGKKQYHIVYSAMGSIYDMRGNYRMAKKYFQDALNACEPNDTSSLISIYSRIASLQAHREPLKAKEINELFGKMAVKHPQYYKVHTVLKAEIAFYLNDRQLYEEAYRQFQQVNKEHPLLDVYGKDLMTMVKATFDGNYSKALDILQHDSPDFDALDRCDMRIRICELMGNKERAIKEVAYRRDLRDSLNSDMMFESINEINAEMGLQRMKEEALEKEKKATKRQNLLLSIALIMVVAALGLVISRNLMRRHYQKKLMKQNKELEVALSRAEESDRMKDSFIKHVSHEIRTPLNIITGYTQIINNPEYDLTEEERSRMLSDISKNTQEITYIVNELLEVAENESREYYPKEDILHVNSFFYKLLHDCEMYNTNHLTLHYSSTVDNNFTIKTNRRVLEKVIIQLMMNALKFTPEGTVTMDIQPSSNDDMLRVMITDTGIGIPEEHRDHIFERFYKVDTFKPGFGLGLTISRKLAVLLGGSLVLDNEYRNGSRFVLYLPIEKETSSLLP